MVLVKRIATLTMKLPALYTYDVYKLKMEFLKSVGFSELDIARILFSEPYILSRNLENQIIPSVEILRRLLGSDEDVVIIVKKCYRILENSLDKVLEPDIDMLRGHGVSESLIPEIFLALRSAMSTTLWRHKWEILRSCGMSKDEIDSAFRLQPQCMITSAKKIQKMMHFFLNKVNFNTSYIRKNPNLLMSSFEKRVVPRCSVLQLLLYHGLIQEDTNYVVNVLIMTEETGR
ncbi:uncharacterized protein LOC126795348 [Argentina anserina]|uniref:uncharacterized protein LOC126795348 n=1 Tax=Argentina anserina TaxID=57926 RepID=UPI0021769497|nr:uncharacterized protein LOC126795348 [Potentilla anserina]